MWSLLSSVLLLSIGFSTCKVTTLRERCKTSKTKLTNFDNDEMFSLKTDNGYDYIYLKKENVFMIYNALHKFMVIINGSKPIVMDMYTPSGAGAVINYANNLGTFYEENNTSFDLSDYDKNNYTVITELYKYAKKQSDANSKEDASVDNPGTFNMTLIFEDFNRTDNVSDFKAHENEPDQIEFAEKYYKEFPKAMHNLFETANYTPEMGAIVQMAVHTNYTILTDPTLKNLAEVARFLVEPGNYKQMKTIMPDFIRTMKSNIPCEKSTKFLWALRGANITYPTMEDSLEAFRKNKIVETHYVTVTKLTDKTYYLSYSMMDGVSHLRITYDNQQFTQYTYNKHEKHWILWTPSIPFALNFLEGDKFGLINWHTGFGLVINGTSNQTVLTRANDNKMVDEFNAFNFPKGFALMSEIINKTKIDNNSIDIEELLGKIHGKQDISSVITDTKDLDQFKKDFAMLMDKFNEIKYLKDLKGANLIKFILYYVNQDYFAEYFANYVYLIYNKAMPTLKMYEMMYASFLNNGDKKWQQPLFKNINDIVKDFVVPRNADTVLRMRILFDFKINVEDRDYLKNGLSGQERKK